MIYKYYYSITTAYCDFEIAPIAKEERKLEIAELRLITRTEASLSPETKPQNAMA